VLDAATSSAEVRTPSSGEAADGSSPTAAGAVDAARQEAGLDWLAELLAELWAAEVVAGRWLTEPKPEVQDGAKSGAAARINASAAPDPKRVVARAGCADDRPPAPTGTRAP
jgi:hypothetical protein